MFLTKKYKQRIRELEKNIEKLYDEMIEVKYEFVFDNIEPKYHPETNTTNIDFIIKEKTVDGIRNIKCSYAFDFVDFEKMKLDKGFDIQSRIKRGIVNTTLYDTVRRGLISGRDSK